MAKNKTPKIRIKARNDGKFTAFVDGYQVCHSSIEVLVRMVRANSIVVPKLGQQQ